MEAFPARVHGPADKAAAARRLANASGAVVNGKGILKSA
jgi:hypothetical protein